MAVAASKKAAPKAATIQTVASRTPTSHMDIDAKTGLIRSLVFKKKNVDLFAQRRQNIPPYACGLRIYDELDQRLYDDLTQPVHRPRRQGRARTA